VNAVVSSLASPCRNEYTQRAVALVTSDSPTSSQRRKTSSSGPYM
jgi:hypothetical protein